MKNGKWQMHKWQTAKWQMVNYQMVNGQCQMKNGNGKQQTATGNWQLPTPLPNPKAHKPTHKHIPAAELLTPISSANFCTSSSTASCGFIMRSRCIIFRRSFWLEFCWRLNASRLALTACMSVANGPSNSSNCWRPMYRHTVFSLGEALIVALRLDLVSRACSPKNEPGWWDVGQCMHLHLFEVEHLHIGWYGATQKRN